MRLQAVHNPGTSSYDVLEMDTNEYYSQDHATPETAESWIDGFYHGLYHRGPQAVASTHDPVDLMNDAFWAGAVEESLNRRAD